VGTIEWIAHFKAKSVSRPQPARLGFRGAERVPEPRRFIRGNENLKPHFTGIAGGRNQRAKRPVEIRISAAGKVIAEFRDAISALLPRKRKCLRENLRCPGSLDG